MKTSMLTHTIERTAKSGRFYKIKIQLGDPCKNGHEDFSITASYWDKGERRTEDNACVGAYGDSISKDFPELAIFNDLHLCDWNGIPMHFVANGYYHLTVGFNNLPPESGEFKERYCEYYRINTNEFNLLKTAYSQTHFAILVSETDILVRYKDQANKAIKMLEEWTGEEFESKATKSNWIVKDEAIKEEFEKISNGYYTEEARQERVEAAIKEEFEKMEAEANAKIEKVKTNLKIDKVMFTLGVSNYIYYSHSNTLKFNWKSYEKKVDCSKIMEVEKSLKELIDSGMTIKN